jgi:hypothetical protein
MQQVTHFVRLEIIRFFLLAVGRWFVLDSEIVGVQKQKTYIVAVWRSSFWAIFGGLVILIDFEMGPNSIPG